MLKTLNSPLLPIANFTSTKKKSLQEQQKKQSWGYLKSWHTKTNVLLVVFKALQYPALY